MGTPSVLKGVTTHYLPDSQHYTLHDQKEKAPSGAGRNVSEMRSIDAVEARGFRGSEAPPYDSVPSPHEKSRPDEAGSCGYIDNYLTFLDDLDKITAFNDWLDMQASELIDHRGGR